MEVWKGAAGVKRGGMKLSKIDAGVAIWKLELGSYSFDYLRHAARVVSGRKPYPASIRQASKSGEEIQVNRVNNAKEILINSGRG